MKEDITEIRIGGSKVGLFNLRKAIIEVHEKGITDKASIMAELLRIVRSDNYVPISAEREYCEALYREFLRFEGMAIPDEPSFLEIRVLGPGCPRCEELGKLVKNVVAELKLAADVQHIRDLKEISKYGLFPTPGLVVNGKMVSAGKVPSSSELERLLTDKKESERK